MLPSQTGLLVAAGVGFKFTTTTVDDVFVQLFPSVTVTVYVPASFVVALPVTVGL